MPDPEKPITNEYIYIIRPVRLAMLTDGSTPAEDRRIGEHFAYLKGLVDSGVAQLVGRTMVADDRTFGIMIFRAASDAEAHEIMAADPAVINNVFQADVLPFCTILTANPNIQ
jgi:uncharacterized protein YciI